MTFCTHISIWLGIQTLFITRSFATWKVPHERSLFVLQEVLQQSRMPQHKFRDGVLPSSIIIIRNHDNYQQSCLLQIATSISEGQLCTLRLVCFRGVHPFTLEGGKCPMQGSAMLLLTADLCQCSSSDSSRIALLHQDQGQLLCRGKEKRRKLNCLRLCLCLTLCPV